MPSMGRLGKGVHNGQWRTRHADRPPQEVTQRRKAPGCGRRVEPRVCGPQGLAQNDPPGPAAVAMLVHQHHRPPEDGPLQAIRRRQKHACSACADDCRCREELLLQGADDALMRQGEAGCDGKSCWL